MLGAIIGDICGSVYEWNNFKTTNPQTVSLLESGCTFTDNSVLTVATAEVLLQKRSYVEAYKEWARRYISAGYGGTDMQWVQSESLEPYNSWGNGSAIRVSPVGWVFGTLEETLAEAQRSAEVTHNHPEGIKGAQAVAVAVFLARTGNSKSKIKAHIEAMFGYNLKRTTDEIRPDYAFDVSCTGSVPEAIICFLESEDYVHALQLAISIGGDSDAIACIAGSIAEAFYREIPDVLVKFAQVRLTDEMKLILDTFREIFLC